MSDHELRLENIKQASQRVLKLHADYNEGGFEQFYELGKKIGEGLHT